ncbi:MAG: 23S rRNA (pseudouridine(1915)-N(3))-methyltransferase RlmH [Methylocella sp.]
MVARYVERAAAAGRAIGISGVELGEAEESRAARPDERKREAAQAIRGLLAPPANVIALDESGTQMTSRSLATELGRARDKGLPAPRSSSAARTARNPLFWHPLRSRFPLGR